jgi:hypothetical protein
MKWEVPDQRGWAMIGVFGLGFTVILALVLKPELGDNQLFATIATLIFGSGMLGLICSFLWGGSKATNSAIDTVNDIAKTAQPTEKK